MKEKNKKQNQQVVAEEKDVLSQQDLISGASTVSLSATPHAALETPDGKNNGAEPAVFQNQRKAHT